MDEAMITEGPLLHRFAVECQPCGTRVGGVSELEVGMWALGHDTAANRHNAAELASMDAQIKRLQLRCETYRAELATLRAVADAARELHPNWQGVCRTCIEPREGLHPAWPCPTVRALVALPARKD